MELAMHPLHDPHGLNGMMDDVPYPSRGTRHSELSNALGGITLRRPELDWIDQGHTAPHRAPPHDHSLHPPQAVVSASAFTHGVPRELNADVSPASHGPAGPGAYNLGNPNYTESTSTLWTTARGPLSGDYNTYEHNDFSHTPLFHPVPRTLGSTYKFMEPGAGEPSDHWTATAAQAQDTLEAMEPEPHQSDGFSVGCFQETDRDGHPPSSRILPSCAAVPSPPKPPPSTIQYGLEDAAEIHKHMRRSVGGGATCAWAHGDGECGYSSHVDLVKRHIKRVHYRLKPCACEHCGRRFFNNYALSLHYNTHTGRKPFACEICGRGFASPSGKSHHRITRHKHQIRTHSIGQYVRWMNVPFERRGEIGTVAERTGSV